MNSVVAERRAVYRCYGLVGSSFIVRFVSCYYGASSPFPFSVLEIVLTVPLTFLCFLAVSPTKPSSNQRAMPPKRSIQQNQLPSGPSVVLDEAATQGGITDGAPVSDAPRRRCYVSEQSFEDALVITSTGKVNAKNAWDVKILEGMESGVDSCMTGDMTDQSAQFAKAGQLVELSTKVWSLRLEQCALASNQVYQRMMRNDTRQQDETNEEEGDGAAVQTQKRKKKALERTIAESNDEIDLDVRKVTGNEAIGAQFRAMTEKFDQSHSQGLLLNNAPFGALGNLILDRDMAEDVNVSKNRQQDDIVVPQIEIALPRNSAGSQHLADSPLAIPYARPQEADAAQKANEAAEEGNVTANTSRAGSVYVRDANQSRANSSYRGDDNDDDDGGDYGDYGGGDDDDDDNQNEPQNTARSAVGSIARGLISGRDGLDHLDRIALRNETSDWVPLSQHPQSQGGMNQRRTAASSQLLQTIRKQFTLPKATNPTPNDPPAGKKRGPGKTVSFANIDPTQKTQKDVDAQLEQLKMNRTPLTAVTQLGRAWLQDATNMRPQLYADAAHAEATANQHRIVQPRLCQSFKHSRRDFNVNRAFPTAQSLHAPNGGTSSSTAAAEMPDVKGFFQPFCTRKEQWSVLNKTTRGHEVAVTNIPRYGGNDEEYHEDIVGAMPMNVFGDDYDDYGHDGPDDDDGDDGAVAAFNIPSGPDVDLPDLGAIGEGELQDLVEQPETVIRHMKISRATAPTQVDVVKLRHVTWDRISRLCPAPSLSEAERKKLKRAREDSDDEEEEPERVHIEEKDKNTFANVMAGTLPYVKTFAQDGTLSPSFMFFSMLFLANEHGLQLKSSEGDTLNDVQINRKQD